MPETFYIIDGFAQIFRAYYAIRGGMKSPHTGEPTQAIFGFAGMLIKLLSQLNPAYIVAAVDMPGKTFRDELVGDYKATRQATPEDLTSQIPRVFHLIGLFGIPVVGVPGLEADDVIATIVDRILHDPAHPDIQIRIISKDKDLEQLLCDRVCMFDVHTDTILDADALKRNKGITPEQVIDLLSLTGDTVDNVAGIEGIGTKTAALLLQEYGSLDGIYENIEQIKGKRRENLEKGRDRMPLARSLVSLKRDADFHFELESARVVVPNVGPLTAFFQELGFNRYQEEIKKVAAMMSGNPDAVTSVKSSLIMPTVESELTLFTDADKEPLETAAAGSYHAITTLHGLQTLLKVLSKQKIKSFDTETSGLEKNSELCGLSFAWQKGSGVYIPVRSPQTEKHLDIKTVLDILRPIFESAAIKKCGHNLKFDANVLIRHGMQVYGVVFDSFLASTLMSPNRPTHKLDHLAVTLLNYEMIPIESLIGTGSEQIRIDEVSLDQVVPYAAEDADIALRLYQKMIPELKNMGMEKLMEDAEAPLVSVIAEMEINGILCDPEELLKQGAALGVRVEELRLEIVKAAGFEFDLNSPSQLATVLFDKLGMKPGKKTKTGYSTDIQELERLAALEDRSRHETAVPRLIIEYRQLTKLISTYLGNLRESIDPVDGRIHTTFHQLYTATGRLASSGPNLQNIPIRTDIGRQIRKAFHAPEGSLLICADYSQIELRILAHLSEDAALLDAFANDLDIHTAVASQVFGVPLDLVSREQRSQAKTINFGIIYGVTAFGLARRVEGLDVSSATRLISDYKMQFPGIDRFLQECIQQASQEGYVTTLLGRRRAIPEIISTNTHTRSLGERLAINSVVQGSAADLIKLAMVNVHRRIVKDSLPIKLLLQIHDELVFESPDESAVSCSKIIQEEMENAMSLKVPLRCSAGLGYDWLSAK